MPISFKANLFNLEFKAVLIELSSPNSSLIFLLIDIFSINELLPFWFFCMLLLVYSFNIY